MTRPHNFDILLLDIEGTTTPISFVYDILFPYARDAMASFLNTSLDDLGEEIEMLRRQAQQDIEEGAPQIGDDPSAQDVLENVLWQMAHDKKTTGLKQLQGKIWKAGYADGTLKGAIFDDVLPAFKGWKAAGKNIYIYSSGSVAAQRLLFGHSTEGDLMPMISGYFDTTTGPKKVASSYKAIARAMDVAPDTVCFATDNLDEARAAHEANMHVVVMARPGNPDVGAHDFYVAQTFEPLV